MTVLATDPATPPQNKCLNGDDGFEESFLYIYLFLLDDFEEMGAASFSSNFLVSLRIIVIAVVGVGVGVVVVDER